MIAGFEFRPSLPVLILQRADGDFQHGVLGEQGQPRLPVAALYRGHRAL